MVWSARKNGKQVSGHYIHKLKICFSPELNILDSTVRVQRGRDGMGRRVDLSHKIFGEICIVNFEGTH